MQLRIRQACASVSVLALAAGTANAAGLYPKAQEDLKPISWTGFVIAPYFGYETTYLKGAGSAGLSDPSGWRVGAELDYDYQIGNFVVGIAGDAFYTWYDSNGIGAKSAISTRLFDYETVRARLGYAVGRWMFFGTAGAAFGELEISDAATGVSDRQTLTGWTAGGGAEWVWDDNFALRGEVDHMDFGSANFASLPAPNNEVGATLDLFKVDFVSRF
jgi:outer membrane immunogenic protein